MTVERVEITTRDNWLERRKSFVGASEVAAVCGKNPYRSPLAIYHEKIGSLDGEPETNLMRRGRWMEPAAIRALSELRPDWKAHLNNFFFCDAELHLCCTPDAWGYRHGKSGIIQIKTVSPAVFERDWTTPVGIVPPLHVQLQALVEAQLTGAPWVEVVAMVGDAWSLDCHIEPVQVHEGAWGRIVGEVAEFWDRLQRRDPPEIMPDRDAVLVDRLYPASDPKAVADLSKDNLVTALIWDWQAAVAGCKAAKDEAKPFVLRRAEIETELKAKLGGAERATVGDVEILWKTQKRKATPATEFRKFAVRPARSSS